MLNVSCSVSPEERGCNNVYCCLVRGGGGGGARLLSSLSSHEILLVPCSVPWEQIGLRHPPSSLPWVWVLTALCSLSSEEDILVPQRSVWWSEEIACHLPSEDILVPPRSVWWSEEIACNLLCSLSSSEEMLELLQSSSPRICRFTLSSTSSREIWRLVGGGGSGAFLIVDPLPQPDSSCLLGGTLAVLLPLPWGERFPLSINVSFLSSEESGCRRILDPQRDPWSLPSESGWSCCCGDLDEPWCSSSSSSWNAEIWCKCFCAWILGGRIVSRFGFSLKDFGNCSSQQPQRKNPSILPFLWEL